MLNTDVADLYIAAGKADSRDSARRLAAEEFVDDDPLLEAITLGASELTEAGKRNIRDIIEHVRQLERDAIRDAEREGDG